MSDYITRDSGNREEFGNGSVRDTNAGKPRPDLISPVATERKGNLLARGAEKYGERNWEKGQPLSRFRESKIRHGLMYDLGDRTEDHLAAEAYNVDGMMHFEGTEWDDINEHPDHPGLTHREVFLNSSLLEEKPVWDEEGGVLLQPDTPEPMNITVFKDKGPDPDEVPYLVYIGKNEWAWSMDPFGQTNFGGLSWTRVCSDFEGHLLEVIL